MLLVEKLEIAKTDNFNLDGVTDKYCSIFAVELIESG
jgi:hypothetical protein